jgi:3-methyladenine DNA glycosylase Tag
VELAERAIRKENRDLVRARCKIDGFINKARELEAVMKNSGLDC